MQTNPPTLGISIPAPPARKPAIGEDSAPARYKDDSASARYKGEPAHGTRAALVWAATVIGLVLLSLLIVFILQNQEPVQVQYLGFVGSVPLGMALFIAAVAGGLLVATAGAVRITQLRIIAARARDRSTARPPARARIPRFRHGHHAS